jgi:hypothetical protein
MYASHRNATGIATSEWSDGSYEIGNRSGLNLLLGICRRYHDMSPPIAWGPCAGALSRVKKRQDRRQARGGTDREWEQVNSDGEAAGHHHTLTMRLTSITDDPNDH